MSMNYQMETSHIVDYQLHTLPGVPFVLRGPAPAPEGKAPAIGFIGAAQTFGAFCKYPFPTLLGEMASARVFNFGRGGAGAGFFLDQPGVIDHLNRTDLCVVQLMSARSSIDNSYMHSTEGLASVIFKKGSRAGEKMLGHRAFQLLAAELSREEFHALVQETLAGAIDQYRRLLARITVPKVLVYVGRKPPLGSFDLKDPGWAPSDMIGQHPHMIDQATFDAVAAMCDDALMVHGSEGADQRLMNRFTGDYCSITRPPNTVVTRHSLYISPALHVKAALRLYPIVSGRLAERHAAVAVVPTAAD